jgi:hypothetical protein
MSVAKTILSQIKIADSCAMLAWGARDLVSTNSGLQFRVGGHAKFSGLVHVKYNKGTDTYDVDFTKIKKGMPIVVKAAKDVFVEDLVNTIDAVV